MGPVKGALPPHRMDAATTIRTHGHDLMNEGIVGPVFPTRRANWVVPSCPADVRAHPRPLTAPPAAVGCSALLGTQSWSSFLRFVELDPTRQMLQ